MIAFLVGDGGSHVGVRREVVELCDSIVRALGHSVVLLVSRLPFMANVALVHLSHFPGRTTRNLEWATFAPILHAMRTHQPVAPFVRTTLSAPSLAAFANVSYAFIMSFIAKR